MFSKTHLDVLRDAAAIHPTTTVFRLPDPASLANGPRRWTDITYLRFQSDVELSARYWTRVLDANGIPHRSVVALWLGGMSYMDVLHIYGVTRAGYIPQLCSLRLPNPDVIFELMQRADARALIHDSTYQLEVSNCPVPTAVAVDIETVEIMDIELETRTTNVNAEDVVMIFHTSGSTSGCPKLVPCTRRWLDATLSKAATVGRPAAPRRQDVNVWMGSMCHIGQTFMLIAALQNGSCVVQPTAIAFTSDELVDMIRCCGLNRLMQFAGFLAVHLRNSRSDLKLLGMLQGLDEVLYSGLPLPRDEEDWAYRNGIRLRNLFGNTECGAMLYSIGGRDQDAALLRPIEGTSYAFVPVNPSSEASFQNPNALLLELVILSSSGDCPDSSLRGPDGNYHTGDLFLEAKPGRYVFRGRDDDWIKSQNALRCDTKAIEDNVRATCSDLVAECVVVGNGRPSPTLFVEQGGQSDEERLKKEIIRRTRHFHSRRYLHEQIISTKFIIVVPSHSLPRTATKGNIRRRAVEAKYKAELDCVYAAA